MANDAEAYRKGEKTGWASTAWDGIQKSIDLLDQRRIKLVINGGQLNPRGLAEKTHELVGVTSNSARSIQFVLTLIRPPRRP
jgi:hypothetical protein